MSLVRTLSLVWAALLGLLLLTLGASFALTGPASLAASLAIAVAKAALIYWFFMHLREEGGLVRLAALGVAAWLVIFTLLTSADYAMRP
ncbi:cytochrome C oxidase subunit IV family protein [Ancylobacter sp. MQZ15Z-1]|uniref:Cytochrome C oxidase subunit IV family protein n=1 Tax=Ancylobacter mangrovi TaxID=2972472 RepID=A0A9X2T0L2_9HYPH|nr:cytochrome C oxidase subunit IV family protein [Ancylobacter mangrovi]MCS0493985.1 cytochrome C oxidase subunit IV family protein [Ancylobacter mangrovi]